MTLSLGTPIGHYTVIEHVGAEGTTAEVYRARDDRHDRVVALKLLPGTSELSRREAAAVTALDHLNIVATLDVTEHNGRLCLVQEWIDGGSLADELGLAGQLGVEETVRLGRDVASALRYAHQHNILHRDIKPSNVLRTIEGTYKLADFGAFGQLQERPRSSSAPVSVTSSPGR
ncbi:MAG: serine/threonine-protein kinase [Pseudonocardiales bacterium]